jgi:hypothetical protein
MLFVLAHVGIHVLLFPVCVRYSDTISWCQWVDPFLSLIYEVSGFRCLIIQGRLRVRVGSNFVSPLTLVVDPCKGFFLEPTREIHDIGWTHLFQR